MKTSVTKGTLYLIIAQVIFLVVGYVVQITLGRLMGPEVYGVFGVIVGIMSVVTLVPSSGVPVAVSKFVGENEQKAGGIMREGLRIQLAICTVLFIIYFSSAELIASAFSDPRFVLYVRITSISIFLAGIGNLYYNYLNGMRYFWKQSVVYAVSSITKLLAILLVVLGFGLLGAVSDYLFSYLTILVLSFWFSGRITGGGFDWRKLFYFSAPLIVYAALSNILQNMDLFMVKALLKSDDLAGYYTSASMIGKLFYLLVGTLFATLIPAISNSIAKNDKKRTTKYVTSSIRYAVMLLVPISLVVSPTATGLVSIVYSTKFAPAGEPLSIFIFGACFLTLLTGLSSMIIAAGRPKVCMGIFALACAISLALGIMLIPTMGIYGAAVATTGSTLVGMVIAAYYVAKEFGCLIRVKSLARISIASLSIYLLALFIHLPDNWLLPFEYAVLFGIYFVILLATKEIGKDDFRMVEKVIPKELKIRMG
ncbi:flippase [Candidatus Micrarchaeota archaeon]|nr:flippase [Candidatus Micrarchaeota archaeon]